jgi:hypothetical protein
MSPHSRGAMRPRFAGKFLTLEERAQGMPGAQRARSPARPKKTNLASKTVTTVTPEITRHSPHNGFTAYFVLFPVIGLSCHRRLSGIIPAKT